MEAKQSVSPGTEALGGGVKRRLSVYGQKYGILVALVLVCLVLAVVNEYFLTARNITNVLRQTSINGILAVGMTFVILTRGIDLSVGSVVALAGIVAASLATTSSTAEAAGSQPKGSTAPATPPSGSRRTRQHISRAVAVIYTPLPPGSYRGRPRPHHRSRCRRWETPSSSPTTTSRATCSDPPCPSSSTSGRLGAAPAG